MLGRSWIQGNPTIEVDVFTPGIWQSQCSFRASTGTNEALELRDADPNRYGGKGVLTAVKNVNTIIQKNCLGLMYETNGKSMRLWSSSMRPITNQTSEQMLFLGYPWLLQSSCRFPQSSSLSLFRGSNAFTLPVPTMNVLNGGKHAGNELAIQEFMIQPKGAETFMKLSRLGQKFTMFLESYWKGNTAGLLLMWAMKEDMLPRWVNQPKPLMPCRGNWGSRLHRFRGYNWAWCRSLRVLWRGILYNRWKEALCSWTW